MQKGHIGKKGFTLIELIITVAVLAIISIPLFQYFTESAKQNARMKSQQNAMLVAQNTLEELKSEKIDITTPSALTVGAGAVSGSAISRDWMVQMHPDASGKYTVVRSCTVNGASYKVKADISPIKEVTSTSGTVTYYDMEVPSMNSSKDVIATERGTADINAQMQFYNWHSNYVDANGGTKSDANSFKTKLSKKICIDVKKDPVKQTNTLTEVYYKYKYEPAAGETYPDGIDDTKEYKEVIAKRSILPEKLSDIYIFFTPDSTKSKDTIEISVASAELTGMLKKKQLNLFVVSQSASSGNGLEVNGIGTSSDYFEAAYTNIKKSNTFSGNMRSMFKEDPVTNEYQMIKRKEKSRIAEVQVSVYKGDSLNDKNLAATVEGNITQ